ncbi:protein PFF0380w-like isoform X3 [Metopolophium dirhodum]|uniref:protein PFF0380w-like isoform X3 n=1 Tax=Metopolophium dirhodum TaxID=44670 RepID=UPI00299068BC|nr:protein PFF0380w-like isoform X3 [Metopolophium dirhodum]
MSCVFKTNIVKCKQSPNRKTTSGIKNKNGKRSFLRTSENDVTDDFYYKRKKSIKHSQVDINNAVLTAPNGYIMTRNKLKKQLTGIDNSELVETSVIEDKCSRNDNIRNKSKKANKNRKPSNKVHRKIKNTLQLGFVFTNDISSPYPGKQLDTEYKKVTPSLFESDSDPEIDCFQVKNSIKNELEEISTSISHPDDILCPAFDKNVEMRTYLNKKSYPINNKSNIQSLNTFEEINQKPSSLYNHVKTVHGSYSCNNITQNNSKTRKSLKITDPTTSECVQTNTEDDDIIIVTESFIRQLKNEVEIIKTESQGSEIRTRQLFYDNNANKSNESDTEQHKDNEVVSKILSSDFEVNQINMCTIDTNIDNICDINFKSSISSNLLLNQDMDVIDESHKFTPSLSPSPFETTNTVENSLMSIFDVPKENIVESYANINDSLIINSDSNISATISEDMIDLSSLQTFEFDNSNSDQSIENHPKSENNTTCHLSPDHIEPDQYFHSVTKDEIKIKQTESFNNKGNYNCLKNDNLSCSNDSYSKKYNNLYSECYCKNFTSFNNDDNKIFTSKVKHFAFNNNAKKVRQKILRKKHLEANILNMLITKEHKNIIQSREHKPIFNSILINKKYEKCIESKNNDHIAPSVLSMLKDVYVDVEYLTEYCDYNTSAHKLPEPHTNKKDIKFNIQASNIKPLDITRAFKNNNDSVSNNTSQNEPINLKPCDEKYDNFNKNEIIDNASVSNSTTKNYPISHKICYENDVNFNKNKTIDNVPMSSTKTTQNPINNKPSDESYVNFSKNKIIDDSKINIPKKKKTVNIKHCDGSYVNFNKNKIIDNVSISNTTTQKPVHFKPCVGSYVNFNKNKIIDNIPMSSTKTTQNPINIKPCDGSSVNLNENKIIDNASMSNNKKSNEPNNLKPYEEIDVNFDKFKIINSASTSKSIIKNKPNNPKSCNQNYIHFNKNKITDNAYMANSTTKNKSINPESDEENIVNFNKSVIIENVSTSNNKSINLEPCDQSYVHFSKNKISDSASMPNSITTNKPINLEPYKENCVNFNKNQTIDNVSTSNIISVNLEPFDQSYINFNYQPKDEINYPTINSIEKNDFDCDIVCNSHVVNAEIDTKSEIKVEDYFYYDTAAIKYNFKSEKSPGLETKPFEICNLSDSTIIINKNDSEEEFEIVEKCNDNESENILSSAKIKTIHGFTQTKETHILKDEHKPALAITESEKKINTSTLLIEPPQFKNLFDSSDTISSKSYQICPMLPHISENNEPVNNLFDLPVEDISFSLNNNSSDDDDDDDDNRLLIDNEPNHDGIINKNSTCILKSADSSKDERTINCLSSAPSIKNFTTEIEFCEKKLINPKKKQSSEINLIKNKKERIIEEKSELLNYYTLFSERPHRRKLVPPRNTLPLGNWFRYHSDAEGCAESACSLAEQSIKLSLNPILPKKKSVISNNNCENTELKEKKYSLDDCMSFEMCNEFYKIKSLHKSIVSKNESLPKYIQDILKEMYVDELFVSTCQHMVDLYNDDDQLKNDVFIQTDECRKILSEKSVLINKNVEEKKYSEFNQSISTNLDTLWRTEINYGNQETNIPINPTTKENNSVYLQKPNELRKSNSTNVETLWRTEFNYGNHETNEPSNPTTEENNFVSLQNPNDVKHKYPELRKSISTNGKTILKSEINNLNQQKKTIITQKMNSLQNKTKNVKSNMKIRIHLREFIQSNKPLDEILESKEFRNLRFFGEEEIAGSIGVFVFEQTIDTPIITGLSVYRENYDQLNNEEKNKILASTNLNITCPKITILTSITMALVKMLRSDTLIDVILNVIRRNVLKKHMNTEHTIDDQLIKQVVYFIDICVRLRQLKTLQIFIFDSMVLLPNKYCCIIFISLLMWKNCLPRSINIEEDPVIITAMSFLIAKKKLYSEETVGCDIFQRELINLLSFHFNYTFSIEMPTNFIQHIHKPDFFISVVMFLKCCDPKDLVEFMVKCLFPIIDNYLNTQQNEVYAIQTMDSINIAIKPFKITCNTTVATYLMKCKDPINGFKKNGKEHVYNTIYNSYKVLQDKFIEYLNNGRPRSQYIEESLISIILVLGSVDYLTSCMCLMQWKPKFELSAILSKKIVMFKSIIGNNIVWDKLCAIDDINTLKCLVNSCLLNKDVYGTIIQLHNLC